MQAAPDTAKDAMEEVYRVVENATVQRENKEVKRRTKRAVVGPMPQPSKVMSHSPTPAILQEREPESAR